MIDNKLTFIYLKIYLLFVYHTFSVESTARSVEEEGNCLRRARLAQEHRHKPNLRES